MKKSSQSKPLKTTRKLGGTYRLGIKGSFAQRLAIGPVSVAAKKQQPGK